MSPHRKAERIPAAVGAAWALATLAGVAYLQRPYAGAPGGIVQASTAVGTEPAISKHGGRRRTSLHSPATPQLVRGRKSLLLEGAPQATGEIAGEVANEIPEAFVATARQAKDTLLKVNDGVYWEDVIRTLGTGRVRLQLRDGSWLNIGARSTMRVVKHDPQSQQTEIELKLGRLRGEVMKLTKPGGRFEVKTPTTVLGVVGTILLVDAHDSYTQVCAVEGIVRVRNVNPAVPGEKILHAGECARVNKGQAPGDVANPAPMISMLTEMTNVPDPVAALVVSNNSILVSASEVGALSTAKWATESTGNGHWTTASEWSCDVGTPNCVPNNNSYNVFAAVLDNPGNTLTLDNVTDSPSDISVNTLSLQAGTLDIGSGATLNLANQPSGITDILSGVGLNLEGTFEIGGDAAASGLGSLASVEGTLTLANGQATHVTPKGGTLTNSGTLNVQQSSTLSVTGAFTNSGTMTTGTGGSGAGNNRVSVSGLLTNTGTINLTGPGDSLSGDFDNSGLITLRGNGESLIDLGGFNNNSGGSLSLTANLDNVSVATDFNNQAGASVTMSGTNGSMSVTGTLTNNGTIDLTGSNNSLSADLTNSGAINLKGNGDSVTGTGDFNNNSPGSLSLTAAANQVSVVGTFNNHAGSSVTMSGTNGSLSAAVAFINGGTVTLSGSGDTLSAPSFTNSGNVSIGGNEAVTAGATGTYAQAAGSTTVNGTLTAGGGVSLQGGSLLGAVTIHGSVNNSGGSVEAASAPGVPGTLSIAGNYTQGPNGTLIVDLGSNVPAHSFFDVFADVALDGTVDFNTVNGLTPATGEDFTFLQWGGSESGNFSKMEFTGWSCPTGDTCTDVFGANTLTLEITQSTKTPTPEPSSLVLLFTAMAMALVLGLGKLCLQVRSAR
jgi:hypothetical protein